MNHYRVTERDDICTWVLVGFWVSFHFVVLLDYSTKKKLHEVIQDSWDDIKVSGSKMKHCTPIRNAVCAMVIPSR